MPLAVLRLSFIDRQGICQFLQLLLNEPERGEACRWLARTQA
jgi:hypothetical protein